MNDNQKISIKRIIGNVIGNLGIGNVNHNIDDFARWAVSAEKFIGTSESYIQKECLIQFKNMKACLPDDLIKLRALKYHDHIIEYTMRDFGMFDKGASNGNSVHLASISANRLNNANTAQVKGVKGNTAGIEQESTANALVFNLRNRYVYVNSLDIEEVGIAYEGIAVDKEGWPMISEGHEEAVTSYLMWKYKSIDYFNGKINHHVYKELENRWYWLCGQARGDDELPSPAELEYLANMMNQLLPLPNKKFF